MNPIANQDPELWQAICDEENRQESTLELIASENHVSPAVLAAAATPLTNKYAEGYPGKRYYGGCQYMDVVENLARDRARQLFGCDHVNVQPHSGSQANQAVFLAAISPGDTIMGLHLDHGGHLTHGKSVNLSGKWFKAVHYTLNPKTERIDLAEVRKLAHEHKPKLIITGASAYPRVWDFAGFAEIAHEVGAVQMADMAHFAGLVATGLHPSPVPYAEFVTTTTHKTLRGPRSGMVLCQALWAKKLDSAVFPGLQGGPLMHIIAAKAVAFAEALRPEFKLYCQQIIKNAQVLAEELTRRGYRLVSGGTDNHLMLIDLRAKDANLTGAMAEQWLQTAGMIVNKNMVPFDTRKAMETSGIRVGTPALTTRGLKEPEMKLVAQWFDRAASSAGDEKTLLRIRGEVSDFTRQYPLPHLECRVPASQQVREQTAAAAR
ncbi:MAG: serine hydroxymethyltransferase [Planctomycetes bacterium]|nr:serine hydroxymethyltransferase [Planctomycetota bacterium]